ncbi:inositol monophosphatase family protein [Pantoea sp. Mhis]|uniref:inositol monophosphatase family protein n=1 Tax=Pantoea sp. Mhis TaxID=2576759 RepID=UPI001358BA38|nr:inositol monophosphatase family protein [Pantoea sp. Mhis]MXP56791.1 histidinol-phosphate aminotransferase [Pantoea sp. Mhis]
MLKIAIDAVKSIQQYSINTFYNKKSYNIKSDKSLVTESDVYIETQIRKFLSINTPYIPIFGEELSLDISDFNTGWVIDPIDGTRAFLYGLPIFGTLLSYIENNEPIIGVISFPILNTIIYASQGNGCWIQHKNSVPARIISPIANEETLQNSVVSISGIHSTTFDFREGVKPYKLSNIIYSARDIIFINDSYQHVMVAMGNIDAAIDTLMKPWDIAALLVCMKEAGVICANLNGFQKKMIWGGSLITAKSQLLLDEIINLLS